MFVLRIIAILRLETLALAPPRVSPILFFSFSTGYVSSLWHCRCCPWIRRRREGGEKR